MCGLKLLAGFLAALVSAGLCDSAEAAPAGKVDAAVRTVSAFNFRSVRQAVADLTATFRERYPRGQEFAARLDQFEAASAQALANPGTGGERSSRIVALAAELNRLRAEALLANPLLDFDRLLLVKRAVKQGVPRFGRPSDFYGHYPLFTAYGRELALPQNHHSLAGVPQTGWDNEIAVLSPVRPEGRLATLYRPQDAGYIGEVELHWDADRKSVV